MNGKSRLTVALITLPLLSFLLLHSCHTKEKKPTDSPKKENIAVHSAKGGKYYGGILRLNEKGEIRSLYPPSLVDIHNLRVASTMMESLFRYEGGEQPLEKLLVEDYRIDSSGTVYTLWLKKDVHFHDHPLFPKGKGRLLTAKDVVFCLKQLCQHHKDNLNAFLFINSIKGAKAYYDASKKPENPAITEIEGLRALGKHQLQIALVRAERDFLKKLAHPVSAIYAKEAISKQEPRKTFQPVGTGPFQKHSEVQGLSLQLKKNNHYHRKDRDGNPLPFLDGLHLRFMKEEASILEEFKLKGLDLCYSLSPKLHGQLPDKVKHPYELEELMVQESVYLKLSLYGPLAKKGVRSLFYAVTEPKQVIAHPSISIPAHPKTHIIPPLFNSSEQIPPSGKTDSSKVTLDSLFHHYSLEINELKNKSFRLYTWDHPKYRKIAGLIKEQLESKLFSRVEVRTLNYGQLLRKNIDYEPAALLLNRNTFYHSPEDYLNGLRYGQGILGNGPNTVYSRAYPIYVENMEKASRAKTRQGWMLFLKRNDSLLISEGLIHPLWHEKGFWLKHFYVRGMKMNPFLCPDFSKIYLLRAKKLNP